MWVLLHQCVPLTSWCLHHPFEKDAQVKLDHETPKNPGVNIQNILEVSPHSDSQVFGFFLVPRNGRKIPTWVIPSKPGPAILRIASWEAATSA